MNRQPEKQLNYRKDILLFDSEHFIAVANQFQKRSHLIIRAARNQENSISNILENFGIQLATEFWHIVQQVVADTKKPSMLCHHFGEWRSAKHFHVHIVMNKRDFADYVAKKAGNQGDIPTIIQLISDQSQKLVNRHLTEFKAPEIEQIKNTRPETFGDDHQFLNEYGDYRVELDRDYPWIKFIPKVPLTYSSDPKEIQNQLRRYRQDCFSTMYIYAQEVAQLENVRFYVFRTSNTTSLEYGLN